MVLTFATGAIRPTGDQWTRAREAVATRQEHFAARTHAHRVPTNLRKTTQTQTQTQPTDTAITTTGAHTALKMPPRHYTAVTRSTSQDTSTFGGSAQQQQQHPVPRDTTPHTWRLAWWLEAPAKPLGTTARSKAAARAAARAVCPATRELAPRRSRAEGDVVRASTRSSFVAKDRHHTPVHGGGTLARARRTPYRSPPRRAPQRAGRCRAEAPRDCPPC